MPRTRTEAPSPRPHGQSTWHGTVTGVTVTEAAGVRVSAAGAGAPADHRDRDRDRHGDCLPAAAGPGRRLPVPGGRRLRLPARPGHDCARAGPSAAAAGRFKLRSRIARRHRDGVGRRRRTASSSPTLPGRAAAAARLSLRSLPLL